MLELIWNVTEEATEWFGDSDPSPGAPCLIERTATARLGQYDLTVFEHDETVQPNGTKRAWFNVTARGINVVQMLTDSGDFGVSSLEAGKTAAEAIARALIKAGCSPVIGWWNAPQTYRRPLMSRR
jgi:hypothetical protein